ncbi:hypothetical protein HDU76_012071, partial [Blyttiomyces sp. JEL0837]
TYHLRKHDIGEVVKGELPYGWEENHDEELGTFFIDHVTETHYWNPPWEEETRQLVAKVPRPDSVPVPGNNNNLKQTKDKEMDAKKQQAMDNAEKELADLERKRQELEEVLKKQPSEIGVGVDVSRRESVAPKVRESLAKMKGESFVKAPSIRPSEVKTENVDQAVKDLRSMNEKLESENKKLSNDTNTKPDDDQDEPEEDEDVTNAVGNDVEALKLRLQIEQEERENLREITETLLKEREGLDEA